MNTPKYLIPYANKNSGSLRAANLEWFSQARGGLFMHFGLYSVLGRADHMRVLAELGMPNARACRQMGREWAQYLYKIPVHAYEQLAERFHPDRFDADKIVCFAQDCGLDYINLTTRHHDSFCLWNAGDTYFNVTSYTGRDLVRELYDACEKRGMPLFLYYSHGRDWRHPHAPNNDEWGGDARPEYDPPEPSYAYGSAHDVGLYVDFIKRQILELLRLFPNVAGIWLDGISVPQHGPAEKLRIPELYQAIRSASEHALISYKQGIVGTEDFYAPECCLPDFHENPLERGEMHEGAPIEVCDTVSGSWGYVEGLPHKDARQLEKAYREAKEKNYRLLLNLAPDDTGALSASEMDALARGLEGAARQ